MKVCSSCLQEKNLNDFYKNGDKGAKTICKSCENQTRNERRKAALEKIREICKENDIRPSKINISFEDFEDEIIECGWRPMHEDSREKLMALWQSWQSDGYDASCIRVLGDEEALESTPWLAAETLAHQYDKPLEFVKRGIEACRLANVGQGYFIERYCKGNKDIPRDDKVEYHARVLQGLVVEK